MGRAIVRDPEGLPVRRAAVEPRRQAARRDARRDQGAAPAAEDDDRVRDARPGRGDDDGRPDRRHARRAHRADRHAARALRPSRQPVRRAVHRLAGDERRRRHGCGAATAARTSRPTAACAGRWARGQAPTARRSPTASVPSICARQRRRRGCGSRGDRRRRADRRRNRAPDAGGRVAARAGHARPASTCKPGDRIGLAVDPAKVHVFDQATGSGLQLRPRGSARRPQAFPTTDWTTDKHGKEASQIGNAASFHQLVRPPRPRRARPSLVDEEPGHAARPVRRPAGDRHLQHLVAGDAVQRAFPRAGRARARRRARRRRLPDRVPGDEPRRDADAADDDAVPQPGRRWTSRSRSAPIRSTASCC